MKKEILFACLLAVALILSGCTDGGNGPETDTPGCGGGPGGITGCMGKSAIRDISVAPAVECLEVSANNCNGGVLAIDNKCSDDLEIGGITVPAGEYKLIEFVRNGSGELFVVELLGNPTTYVPEGEDTLSATGNLGGQEITISCLKKNVCGTAKFPPEFANGFELE